MKRFAFLAVGLLAASLVAGAGTAAPTKDPLVAATQKTARAGSAKLEFRGTITASGRTIVLAGSGLLSGNSGRVKLRLPAGLMPGMSDSSLEAIFLVERGGPVIYARLGFLEPQLPKGKRWIRLDLKREAKKFGVDLTGLTAGAGFDVSSQTTWLKYAVGTKKVGSETIRGERMTHYRTQIDLDKAARANSQQADSLRKLISTTGKRTLAMDAWVDAKGYLRQVKQSFSYRTGPGQSMKASVTLTYVSFGAAVAIKAPPAREVVDASDLLGP